VRFRTLREIQNVTQTRANTPAVYVAGNSEVHGLVIRSANNQQDSAAITILTSGTSSHSSVKIADCDYTTTISTGSYYPISVTGSTMRTLILENLRVNAATTGSAIVGLVNGSVGPGWLVADGCRCTGKAYLLGTFTSTPDRGSRP
jgi:hypothetical protein